MTLILFVYVIGIAHAVSFYIMQRRGYCFFVHFMVRRLAMPQFW